MWVNLKWDVVNRLSTKQIGWLKDSISWQEQRKWDKMEAFVKQVRTKKVPWIRNENEEKKRNKKQEKKKKTGEGKMCYGVWN